MFGPMSATIIHEEDVHLDHTTETCYTSAADGVPVDGTITLTLDFEFGYPYDSILIGAIGVHVSEEVSGVGGDWRPANEAGLVLHQNRPNPFPPPTSIEYSLAQAEEVSIEVLDVTGRLVQTLFRGEQSEGDHRVSWDGADESGQDMPAGRYYYRVRVGEDLVSRGMLMLR